MAGGKVIFTTGSFTGEFGTDASGNMFVNTQDQEKEISLDGVWGVESKSIGGHGDRMPFLRSGSGATAKKTYIELSPKGSLRFKNAKGRVLGKFKDPDDAAATDNSGSIETPGFLSASKGMYIGEAGITSQITGSLKLKNELYMVPGQNFRLAEAPAGASYADVSMWGHAGIGKMDITAANATNAQISIIGRSGGADANFVGIGKTYTSIPAGNTFEVYGTMNVTSHVTASGDLLVKGDKIDFTDIPTSDPGIAGRLWNSSGDLKISTG